MTAPWPGETVPGNRWDELAGRTPPRPPAVTVVVVHYEQPKELARTLAALGRQTHPASALETIVVDDGSARAPAVPPGVRLLRQEDLGNRTAAARNLGADHAEGDVICFLDADTSPEPAYIERLTRLPGLAREALTVGRRRHADLAGVPVDAPIEEAGPAHELPSPTWLAEGYAASADLLHADARSYRYVISAVVACSRELHAELGGFDGRLSGYGGEDWEWASRAWQAGALLAHVGDAVAWHDGPDAPGRHDAAQQRRVKNQEALRLATVLPVAGSRPRALRPGRPDVRVRLHRAASAAAAFRCVDGLLEALPTAEVQVPGELLPELPADPRLSALDDAPPLPARIVVELHAPVRLPAAALHGAIATLDGPDPPGTVVLRGPEDAPRVLVRSGRAAARAARWGREDLFVTVEDSVTGLGALPDDPDVEAWLGGWEE